MPRRLNVMTAFLPRENVFFLEEWLLYHLRLGVDHVYLYNNAGSRWLNQGESIEVTGRNKHGVPVYQLLAGLSDAEVDARLQRLLGPYVAGGYVTVIPWQPRDASGAITFNQTDAYRDFMTRHAGTADWSAFIDIDEFMVSPLYGTLPPLLADLDADGVDRVEMRQFGFRNRFDEQGEPAFAVTALTMRDARPLGLWSSKSLVRSAALVVLPGPEEAHGWMLHHVPVGPAATWFSDDDVLRFHHYRYNRYVIARDADTRGHRFALDQPDDRAACYLSWIASTRHTRPGRAAGAMSDPVRAAALARGVPLGADAAARRQG